MSTVFSFILRKGSRNWNKMLFISYLFRSFIYHIIALIHAICIFFTEQFETILFGIGFEYWKFENWKLKLKIIGNSKDSWNCNAKLVGNTALRGVFGIYIASKLWSLNLCICWFYFIQKHDCYQNVF